MLTVTGGVERTAGGFSRLLAAADLAIARFIPVATGQTIIEARVTRLPEPKEHER